MPTDDTKDKEAVNDHKILSFPKQEAPVLFETQDTLCGHLIGIMTLNTPKSLNALSVEMCQLLSQQLVDWQSDQQIVAIVLKGAGDKAFCAGGDIRKLYDSMTQRAPLPNPYATEFFGNEYRLYRQMHFYPKPLILWGDGIIMGGGMGLMAGCSHRIVTERTRFAMPEITIGLFPDATGSWFLQRMPAKTGLFLGLTGALCNAKDALFANLAEYSAISSDYDAIIDRLVQVDWRSELETGGGRLHSIVSRTLAAHTKTPPVSNTHAAETELAESKLAEYWQIIQQIMDSGGLADIDALLQDDQALSALDADFAQERWVQKAIATYRQGCPTSAALTYEIYHRVADLSLEQILYLEANVAVHCAANPDFREGVRALLIDKDKNPQWSRSLAECLSVEGRQYIEQHFDNPYSGSAHPLQEWLGDDALGSQFVR